jgi:hypothetical protein
LPFYDFLRDPANKTSYLKNFLIFLTFRNRVVVTPKQPVKRRAAMAVLGRRGRKLAGADGPARCQSQLISHGCHNNNNNSSNNNAESVSQPSTDRDLTTTTTSTSSVSASPTCPTCPQNPTVNFLKAGLMAKVKVKIDCGKSFTFIYPS